MKRGTFLVYLTAGVCFIIASILPFLDLDFTLTLINQILLIVIALFLLVYERFVRFWVFKE